MYYLYVYICTIYIYMSDLPSPFLMASEGPSVRMDASATTARHPAATDWAHDLASDLPLSQHGGQRLFPKIQDLT